MSNTSHDVKLALGADFLTAFSRLPQKQQNKVRRFLDDFTANPSAGVNAMLQQGKFRILAVAAPRRLLALPAIPTMTELGYPDSNYTSHFGFFAPAKTPEAVLKRLHTEINATLALPDVADRLTKLDNVVAPSSVEQFAQVIRREYEANAKVVAKAGIRSE